MVSLCCTHLLAQDDAHEFQCMCTDVKYFHVMVQVQMPNIMMTRVSSSTSCDGVEPAKPLRTKYSVSRLGTR